MLLFDVKKTTCWWRMFVSRCQVDLSTLSKEQTHKLEMPLEEGEGYLVLLVTLTASAAVTISDLSVNSLEDQKEREEILKRYVWSSSLLPFVCKMFAYINKYWGGKSKYIPYILITLSQWQSFKLVTNIITAGTGNVKKAINPLYTIRYFLHSNSDIWYDHVT